MGGLFFFTDLLCNYGGTIFLTHLLRSYGGDYFFVLICCVVMWKLFSLTVSPVHKSVNPPEEEINPLKTVCGWLCGSGLILTFVNVQVTPRVLNWETLQLQ